MGLILCLREETESLSEENPNSNPKWPRHFGRGGEGTPRIFFRRNPVIHDIHVLNPNLPTPIAAKHFPKIFAKIFSESYKLTTMARKKSALTEQQAEYVENRLDGKSKAEAAKSAGYSNPNQNPELSAKVKNALALARSELSTASQIKRADVIEMLMEAYDMARITAESSAMTAAAREIGKMLGFYEPETIKVELSQGQANMHNRLRMMSDEELLRIASGEAAIIEGEVLSKETVQ